MQKREIRIDFDKKCGRIKPLHSINGGPRSGGYGLPYDFSEEFSEMGIPYVRTESSAGEYGLNQFINIHCIFPDFNADEELYESYNFLPTDLYLASIRQTGAQIIFRLGESREPYNRKLYARSPADIEKWARICEHIVMHYNEGWGGGPKLNIRMWEIWSSADSREGWASTPREFYELYRVTASRLRERFPKIKIGAYGSGGFYSLNRLDASETMKDYISFLEGFLSYITNPATEAPIDFFTWSCYTDNPEELSIHAKFARNYLDGAGLRRVKSIISEYNTVDRRDDPPALNEMLASELGAAMIIAQKSPVDMMVYSSSDVYSRLNSLFSIDDRVTHHRYSSFAVMKCFDQLYRLATQVDSGDDHRKELYTLAAIGESEGGVLLVSRAFEGRAEISFASSPFRVASVQKTVSSASRGKGTVYRSGEVDVSQGRLLLSVLPGEIYYIRLA